MTQPPQHTPPPPAGPPPAGGGFAPSGGPAPLRAGVPPQHTPPPYAGLPPYPPPAGYAPYPPGAPAALAPNGQPLAGFADRLLAWLIDSLVASLLAMVLFAPVLIWIWSRMPTEMFQVAPDGTTREPDPAAMLTGFFLPLLLAEVGLVLVMFLFYWLYHVEYARRRGQTLGKKVMRLRIVPLDPATTLTRGHLGRRYLVEFVAGGLVPFLNYLDGFWQLWDRPWQQCLHDKFAGTVVVKVAP